VPSFVSVEDSQFQLLHPVGRGGMGAVYAARDRRTGEWVALKRLLRHDPASLYRFKREFRLLAGLRHPNLVSLFELGCDELGWFFTMELVRGVDFLAHAAGERAGDLPVVPAQRAIAPGNEISQIAFPETVTSATNTTATAAQRIAQRTDERVRPPAVLSLLRPAARQLGTAIHALHQYDRLHCDIKPSNILVEDTGRVVLLDFGIISEVTSPGPLTHQGGIAGTPRYMAPEVARGEPPTPASDWYGFGLVLYEALTGRRPFPGRAPDAQGEMSGRDPPAAALVRPQLAGDAPDLVELAEHLLHPIPERRPRGDEVLDRLGCREASRIGRAVAPAQRQALRWRELDSLIAHFRQLSREAGASTLVTGPSGIGKSELLRQFARWAHGQGAILFETRCFEREAIPHKALDGLVDALCSHVRARPKLAEALADTMRAMAAVFPTAHLATSGLGALGASGYDRVEGRRRAFAALREALEFIARGQRTVLIVDDLQWGDIDSADFVAELLHTPPAHVLFVGGARSEALTKSPFLRYLLHDGPSAPERAVPSLSLEPMTDTEIAEIVGGIIPRAPSFVVSRIVEEARGSPLFAHELASSYATQDIRDSFESGVSLEAVIAQRFERLPAAEQRLLEVLAVAGRPLRRDLARQAAKLQPRDPHAYIGLISARLVQITGARHHDTIEVYHDRVRTAILAALDPQERRRVHLNLATALSLSDDPDAEALAVHFAAGGRPEQATAYALAAADRALEQLAFDRAAILYGFALDLDQLPPSAARSVHYKRADALASAGRGLAAASEYAEAAGGAELAERIDCHARAAEQSMMSGHFDDGVAMVRRVLAEVGEGIPATERRAIVKLLWTRLRLRLRGYSWRRRDALEVPALALSRVDVLARSAQALAFIDPLRGQVFHSRRMVAALRAGEPHRLGQALCDEAILLACNGSRARRRAGALIDRARQLAATAGTPALEAWTHLAGGLRHYFAGEVRQAISLLELAENEFLCLPFAHWGLINARVFRIFALRFAGHTRDIRRLAPQWIRDARSRGDLYAETTLRRTTIWGYLGTDEPARAWKQLHRARWNEPGDGFHLQHYYQLEAESILTLYERRADRVPGLLERLDRLDQSLLPHVQIVRIVSRWLRGRLLLLGGDPWDLRIVERLARKLRGEDVVYGDIAGLLLRGSVAYGQGDRARAVPIFEEAAERAATAGHRLAAQAARWRAAELAGKRPDRGTCNAELLAAPGRVYDTIAPCGGG